MKKSVFSSMGSQDSVCGSGDGADLRAVVSSSKRMVVAESFEREGNSWFVNSHIPTDLTIKVEDVTFLLHKYPLLSRCGYFNRFNFKGANQTDDGPDVVFETFPGGPEAFVLIARFCYGFPIDLNPENAPAIRCAAEILEMTSALEDHNLITRSESFLALAVFPSWAASLTVLKACESLFPWAETSQIVRRCCDSISKRVCDGPPIGHDGLEHTTTARLTLNEPSSWLAKVGPTIMCPTIGLSIVEPTTSSYNSVGPINGLTLVGLSSEPSTALWWFDDVVRLRIDHFSRILTSIKSKLMDPKIIGQCITHYAKFWLPITETLGSELQLRIQSGADKEINWEKKEEKAIIESLVGLLPQERGCVSCAFLSSLLRLSMIFSVAPALVTDLEKRVGYALEEAEIKDLLIPSYNDGDGGGYDVDIVHRIVEYYLMQVEGDHVGKGAVGRLIDGYLAEVAGDHDLSVAKFQTLAEVLPATARLCDDGLYRAIDTYLKSHPSLSEHERRRLCKLMDCQRLSPDACMHAAQNERLPLRTVVQVLYAEQAKFRVAYHGKDKGHGCGETQGSPVPVDKEVGKCNCSSTKREVKAIKAEIERMKAKLSELQHDYSELQHECTRLNKHKNLSVWGFGWRKLKNSALFQGKMYLDQINETQENPVCSQQERRRRASVS
ncbi:hypothetical protein AMTRI_Chr04g181940 [Amborella trichopoda]